jgi:hypothetical protein
MSQLEGEVCVCVCVCVLSWMVGRQDGSFNKLTRSARALSPT